MSKASSITTMSISPAPQVQPRNPLHGLTLQTILTALVDRYGWADLVQCATLFCTYPALAASAAFARVTLVRMSVARAVQMNGLGSML
jgi:uncharacterized protein (DUF2132 family)